MALLETIKQFCLKTNLHGFRFIVLPKRLILERTFWCFVVFSSIVVSLVLLLSAWFDFRQNPTEIVTESTHHPIWNYPFPAVTICSFNKFSKIEMEKFANKLGTDEENLKILSMFFTNDQYIPPSKVSRMQNLLDENNLEIKDVVNDLSPNCSNMLSSCKWKGDEELCEHLFQKTQTPFGYCCSFNYNALTNPKQFHTKSKAVFPYRVSGCGRKTALQVLLKNHIHDYSVTEIPSRGHKILIHDSWDFPDDLSATTLYIEAGFNTLIGLTPSSTYSSAGIANLDVSTRKCYFSNESQLNNFRNYSYSNCLTECRMNLTRSFCNCVPFFYSFTDETYPETEICDLEDLPCLQKNKHFIENGKSCVQCLPDCDYFNYEVGVTAGKYIEKYSQNNRNLFGGENTKNGSIVRVFFKDLVGTRNKRDIIFSWHTLLAYYGGLLGVFTGFSFISGIQLAYFFTFRLIKNIKNEKSKKIKIFPNTPHK